jgi:hypothetical protein
LSARTRYLHPLVYPELPQFELLTVLRYGTIPSIYFSEEPEEDLRAYCGTYLKEEIQAENAVRKIENFSRFLETAAYLSYRKDYRKCIFWRTAGGHEVDFVIGDDTAVEVKGSENISERYCKSLEELLVNAVCPAR